MMSSKTEEASGKNTNAPTENSSSSSRKRKSNNNNRRRQNNKRGNDNRNGKNNKDNRKPSRNNNNNTSSEAKKMDIDKKRPSDNAGTNIESRKVHITGKRFADLKEVCIESRRALAEAFKYEFMTEVQAQTLPVILDSTRSIDVLAKAKTGTGKTLGFLIPAVEKLILTNNNKGKTGIGCLVISPTRELAYQISKEAEKLVSFQNRPKINVLVCVGGTNINKDRKILKQGNVNILVATPGRLLDHLKNQEMDLPGKLSHLDVLVLDEADQLLDMGFRPDIERVLKLLQPSQQTRQTLLFSATVPGSVAEIAGIAMKSKYEYIDTVGEDEEQTHVHVRQELMVAPSSNESEGMGTQQILAIASILDREVQASSKGNPCKVMVFFTTARSTGFMAELFNSVSNRTGFPKFFEIHSRKSQSVRQKASERFRVSKENAIMFSSDVSARGMDYPGVTFVLQVGLTERAQYIHRLGRTARAGKEGRGALLLAPYEKHSMTKKTLSDMPLEPVDVPELNSKMNQAMDAALSNVGSKKELTESAEQAYRAWLGYYNGNLKKVGWDKKRLVKEANQWAKDVGLNQQPSLLKRTVGKMGLKGVPGLKLE
jgi:ATP-dependent RNA helicase MSS116